MSLRFAYSSLPWKGENLESNLERLSENGWQGGETRESLDQLGTPARILRVCANAGIEIAAVSGPNVSGQLQDPAHELCKRLAVPGKRSIHELPVGFSIHRNRPSRKMEHQGGTGLEPATCSLGNCSFR